VTVASLAGVSPAVLIMRMLVLCVQVCELAVMLLLYNELYVFAL